MEKNKNKRKNKCKYRQECGDAGDLGRCYWGCKMGKSLGKNPGRSTKANGRTEDTAEWFHDYLVSHLTPGKQTNKQNYKVTIGVGFFLCGENLKCTIGVLGVGQGVRRKQASSEERVLGQSFVVVSTNQRMFWIGKPFIKCVRGG